MSAFSADRLPALKVAISASISLAVMVVDFVWLIRDEVKCIWPRIRSSWYARFYVLSRYIGMASQIFNVYFTLRIYCGTRISPAGCGVWFTSQFIVSQSLLAVAEGLLMHRIYALFLRSRIILLILVMFTVGQVASLVISARLGLPNISLTEACIILRSNPKNAYFGATTVTTNIMIFFMTFWRYLRLPAEWTQQGLGRVVIRDSVLSILAISVVTLFLTLSALRVIRPGVNSNITYYWLLCVLWVSIGRMVVNHEKLPREDSDPGRGTWKSTLQLTSQIELGEITQGSTVSDGSVLSHSNVFASDSQESPSRSSVCTMDTVGLGSEPTSAV